MGCLTACRWCCCCFVATVNVLNAILGISFFVIGCFAIWGYWIMRQVTNPILERFARAFDDAKIQGSVDAESLHKAIETLMASTAVVFLVLGALLIIISCLGCCGACFGVPACLITYAVIVGLILLAQASVVIIWFTDSSIFKGCTRSFMEKRMAEYRSMGDVAAATLQMDLLQISLSCCGIQSGDDYNLLATKWNRTYRFQNDKGAWIPYNRTFPYSCCQITSDLKPENRSCFNSSASKEYSNYRTGCLEKVNDLIDRQLKPDNFFYSLAGNLGTDVLLIIGALIIYFHKRQEQADIPHSNVQYKMQAQMA